MAAEERWFRFHEPPFSLHKLADESRTWTRGCIDRYMELDHGNIPFHWPSGKYHPIESAKPVFSHAMLESRIQRTKEPLGRSCLTSFSLLMRHVALWEEEVKGNIVWVLASTLKSCIFAHQFSVAFTTSSGQRTHMAKGWLSFLMMTPQRKHIN